MGASGVGADPVDPGTGRARELLDLAAGLREIDPATAREHALEVRVLARAVSDVATEAEALYRLASIDQSDGDAEAAFSRAFEAAELARSVHDPLVEAWSEQLMAIIQYQVGNLDEALEAGNRALDVYRTSGHRIDEANMLNTVAAVEQSLGDHAGALRTYDDALAVSEALGRRDVAAMVLGNQARILVAIGDVQAAVSVGDRAVVEARAHRPEIVTGLLADLAEAHAASGEHDVAARRFAEIDTWWADRGRPTPTEELAAAVSRGRVRLADGDADGAIDVLERALEFAGPIPSTPPGIDDIEDVLIDALARSGRHAEAFERQRAAQGRRDIVAARAVEMRIASLRASFATRTERLRAELGRLRDDRIGNPLVDAVAPALDPVAAQLDAFERLAVIAEYRESGNGMHTKRVGDLAAEVAHAMGAPGAWAEQLRHAARLHDVGKVVVPEHVLVKSGALTVDEYELMKRHALAGHQLLAGSPEPMFQLAAEVALTHHEWWDGGGYPAGTAGHDIALSGRIVAVVDVFDALLSSRSYKRPWAIDEAARFVASGSGAQFDPGVVDAFATVLHARWPELRERLR